MCARSSTAGEYALAACPEIRVELTSLLTDRPDTSLPESACDRSVHRVGTKCMSGTGPPRQFSMGPRQSVPSKISTSVAGRLPHSAKRPAKPRVHVSQGVIAKRPFRPPCVVTSFEAYRGHTDTMISVIPPFDCRTGYLPPGVHLAPWHEVVERFATNRHRKDLFGGLYLALLNLADAGCRSGLLDGSFVSSTPFPEDYDVASDDMTSGQFRMLRISGS